MGDNRMKLVTVRYRPMDLRELGYLEFFKEVERAIVLAPIALMPERTAILVVIKWRSGPDLTWLNQSSLIDKVQEMGQVKDGTMYLIFGREDPWYFELLRTVMEELRVFIHWPIVLMLERTEITFLGPIDSIGKLMGIFKDLNVEVDIRSIRGYDPTRTGPFNDLTPLQYDCLVSAYRSGFFDDDRKVTLGDLAKGRGISSAAYMKTLRRAQKNLISGLLDAV